MKDKDTTLTPLELIHKLGVFDLDPCGYLNHNTARRLIILPQDGLLEQWIGRVWLNPPYSNPVPFLEKMSRHNNGILLVLASVETKWFHDYVWNKASSVLFLKGRPKFIKTNGKLVQLMRPTVLVAYGDNNDVSLEHSGILGKYLKLK